MKFKRGDRLPVLRATMKDSEKPPIEPADDDEYII